MAKRVKIPGRLESAETGNIVTGADAVIDDAKGKTQAVINSEVNAAIINLAQGKQDNLTFDSAPTEDSPNPVTSAGVYTADKVLSDAIEAILLLIPSAASALNKLVDVQTMNSSIATATASFKGTYNLVSDLHLGVDATHEQIGAALDALSLGADNNDYAFVQVPESDTSEDIKVTQRYKFNGTTWAYEYDLNNSGFTAEQWAAINSGVTSLLVSKLSDLPTNAELTILLAGKQDNLTFDNVPTAGSPNPVKSGGVYARNNEIVALINALDAAKQDVLTFDNAPVEGSPNPVKSGGVYTAISAVQAVIVALDAAKQNVLTFDSTPTLGSPNPVTSSGIKTELNRIDGDITTLNDLYEALTQSALVVVQPTDQWPVASPATSTIYRVVDRVNTPPQNYSDYMWNGTAMVLMATYNNAIDPRPKKASQNLVTSGGVFDNMGALDVSELNATENPHKLAQYVDLYAALAAIPTDYQKGGMSIKFIQGTVQSSDNKYVQYRLMNQSFTNNTLYWQRENDNNSFYELNNEANSLTKMYSKAVKSLYIPFTPNNGYKLCVVARNTTYPNQAKYQFIFYEDNLSGGVISKGFRFSSNDYTEPEDKKYDVVQLNSFGYTESLTGYLIIDWSEITNGSFNTSMVGGEYKVNPKFIISSIPDILTFLSTFNLFIKTNIAESGFKVHESAFYDNRNEDCGLTASPYYSYVNPIDLTVFKKFAFTFLEDSFACCPVWGDNNTLLGEIHSSGSHDVFAEYPAAKKIGLCYRTVNYSRYQIEAKYDILAINERIDTEETRAKSAEQALTQNINYMLDLINGSFNSHKSTIMANMGVVKHNYFYDNRKEDCGLTANGAYDYIDPIDISGFQNLVIHFTFDTAACCPIWDKNDNLLGNIGRDGDFNVFTLYPTAKKIAFCWKKAIPENYTVEYDYSVINDLIQLQSIQFDSIMANMGVVKHNYFYDNRKEDCGLSLSGNYDYTDPIDISKFSDLEIHFTFDTAACCPVWNANNNLLGNIGNTGTFKVFDLFPTAQKIAFCWKKANLNDYTVEYVEDTKDVILEHENRIRTLENQGPEPTPVYSVTWNLPNVLNVPSDFDFWYYENSLVSDYDVLFGKAPYEIDVATDCTTKNIRDGFGNIVCNGTYIRFSLVLNKADGTKTTVSSHSITISQKTKLTNTTKNVIFIGDSYVDNTYGTRGMIGWIDYFASQDGNTLVSKGIRTNEYGYHAETYQGWSESQFLRYIPTAQRAADAPNTRQPSNVVNSPFMFSQDDTVANAVFNFGKYINDFNIGTVDTIVFFLGMNGGNGSSINKMIFGGDNAVVSSMRNVLPDAKIIICMVPPYFNHDNYSIQVKNTGENSRITQSRSYISLFEDKTNISICPVNGYNRIYGYRTVANNLTMFKFNNGELAGDATLPKGISNYDHHPSTSGVQQLAYNIYKMIFAS